MFSLLMWNSVYSEEPRCSYKSKDISGSWFLLVRGERGAAGMDSALMNGWSWRIQYGRLDPRHTQMCLIQFLPEGVDLLFFNVIACNVR